MKYSIELALQVLRDMRAHKLRSVLVLFGIVWGTVAVILLLALGEGFYQAGKQNMQGMASGAIRVWPGTTSKAYQGQPPGQTLHMKIRDVMAMAQALPDIVKISPVFIGDYNTNLQWQKRQVSAVVFGVAADYAALSQLNMPAPGRFISERDIRQQNDVVFLGAKLKEALFGDQNAIGQYILISNIPFLVIGVQQAMRSVTNFNWDEDNALIPYSTALTLWSDKDINAFTLITKNPEQSDQFSKTMMHYLSGRLHFDATDENAMNIFNSAELTKFLFWFFRGIQAFLGFCGALTLGVGGVGVANIMFLIISERTAEFGLRMAVGAKPSHILTQVLLEAGLIVLLGGFIGFIIAFACVSALQMSHLPAWLGTPALSPLIASLTWLILMIVALTAGFFPARRAAGMQPVAALNFS